MVEVEHARGEEVKEKKYNEQEQASFVDPFETPKHVVVVMDALKEFSMEPLEWVLKNVAIGSPCIVTLLGVMPWLNIPRTYIHSFIHFIINYTYFFFLIIIYKFVFLFYYYYYIVSAKTWSDIWSMDLEDLSLIKEWKSDPKYQKVRTLLDLCQHYGVYLFNLKNINCHTLKILIYKMT